MYCTSDKSVWNNNVCAGQQNKPDNIPLQTEFQFYLVRYHLAGKRPLGDPAALQGTVQL